MKQTKHNPTMIIKSKFSNQVHKILEPNFAVKKSERWMKKAVPLTDAQKVEMFDKIEQLHKECSEELNNYFQERNKKKKVIKERIKRGVVSKKKTSKEQWEKIQEQNLVTA